MSRIAAAVFPDQRTAYDALEAILSIGVADGDLETFIVGTPNRNRPSGVMVAVNLDNTRSDERVLDALYDSGARMIERVQGAWQHGHWQDFDPASAPQHVDFEERPWAHVPL